jgi:hypothetical protein
MRVNGRITFPQPTTADINGAKGTRMATTLKSLDEFISSLPVLPLLQEMEKLREALASMQKRIAETAARVSDELKPLADNLN